MNTHASENYLAISHSSSASKSVEIFWAEIYWGRLFIRAESSLIQSSCQQNQTISNILTWHLLGHAIKSVTCFDLQFSRSTRPMTSFRIFIAYINTEGILFNVKNYKMRLKQRSLNWINSMQVKNILFTNVFFSWSLCLLNMFPSMVFPKHLYFSGLFTGACSLYFLE